MPRYGSAPNDLMPNDEATNNMTSMPYFPEHKPLDSNSSGSYENSALAEEDRGASYNNGRFDEAYHFMSSLDNFQAVNTRQMNGFGQEFDEFHSAPFLYTRHS